MQANRDPHPKGERNGFSKLSPDDVLSIRLTYASGDWTQKELAAEFNVWQSCISKVTRGESWPHLPL
jgi:hypothetical protein